jgi:hypothetical protein
VELPAHNGAEAAVLIRKIIIEGFPGDPQLMAQVGNADGGIGPLQKIPVQAVLDLLLTAESVDGTGIIRNHHSSLPINSKFLTFIIIHEMWKSVNSLGYTAIYPK